MFFSVGYLCTFGVEIIIVLVSFAAIWTVRKRKQFARWPVITAIVSFGFLAASGLIFGIFSLGCQGYSVPIYSPNGKMAARVWDSYGGPPFSSTAVEIYSARGLNVATVFDGPIRSVEAHSVRWVSDTELEIDYSLRVDYCASTKAVKVDCLLK